MEKFVSILLSIVLISLVACGTGSGTAKIEIIPEGTELSGALEISARSSASDVSGWWPLTQGFMELHPNVEIIVNDNMISPSLEVTEESKIEAQIYADNLKVRLASGDAPDLIYDSSGLVETASVSGLIFDLNEFMDSDPEYVREDYFENVIEAHEIKGELYKYPTHFSYDVFRFRQDVMDELQIDVSELNGFDYKFLFDTLDKIIDSGKFPEIKYLGREGREGNTFLHALEVEACIDNETMEINFDNPEFIDALRASMEYIPGEEIHGAFYVDGPEELFETNSHFAEGLFNGSLNALKTAKQQQNVTEHLPILSSNGHLYVNATSMSIPTAAKNPELAWEFIKYCIEESETINTYWTHIGKHDGDRFENNIPINKGNFETFFEAYLEGASEEVLKDYFENVYRDLENEIAAQIMDYELSNSIGHILADFFNGHITAEEAAKTMQERAEIYMGENS